MPEIHVGVALSDANLADVPEGLRMPASLPIYARRYREATGAEQLFFELQPTERFTEPARYPDKFRLNRDNRWLHAVEFDAEVQRFIEGREARLGVHQPTAFDLLSSNFFTKYQALSELRRAMDFANGIGAEYFVFNLAQRDKWDWNRDDQIAKGLKLFKELATYYRAHGYSFVPCLENLTYPQFPATGGEMAHLWNESQKLLTEMRLVLNLSHLWRSRRLMIREGSWPDRAISFEDHLEYTLAQCSDQLFLFQLGGCWESESHAIPGLHPQQNPHQHPLKLRESPGVYHECGEMDLNRTLDLLLAHTIRQGRDLHLILEIHDRNFGQVAEAARQIRQELLERAAGHW